MPTLSEIKGDFNIALQYMHPIIIQYWRSLESPEEFLQLGMTTTEDSVIFIINFGDSFSPKIILGSIVSDLLIKFYCLDGQTYSEEDFLKILKLKAFW